MVFYFKDTNFEIEIKMSDFTNLTQAQSIEFSNLIDRAIDTLEGINDYI